jgi:hypothetical protein
MPFSGILRRVARERIDVSEERRDSIIMVARIDELGPLLAATRNRCALRMKTIQFFEMWDLTRAARRYIQEDGIPQIYGLIIDLNKTSTLNLFIFINTTYITKFYIYVF